jgi:hypothetical protein
MGLAAAALVAWTLAGLGCTQNQPTDIQTLKVPADFAYSTTQDVTVKVSVADVDGNVSPGTQVTVGQTNEELVPGNVLLRGITDNQGKFEQVVRVPARTTDLRVQASIMGISNRSDVPILNNEASVAFGPQQ